MNDSLRRKKVSKEFGFYENDIRFVKNLKRKVLNFFEFFFRRIQKKVKMNHEIL